ncbi:MAG TPA: ABC transporter ATP-binding protein [Candidatus Acidoferrales bacterium]|jgi:ATP-binding cassette subfamily B multidrug efflux pump|nr:ABC transporter ATP-binding protein [Candidatus Acidoferrales bacterium]
MLKNLRPLFPYLKKYRWALFWGALTVFGNNGIWVYFPQVLQRAIDSLRPGSVRHTFYVYSLLLLAIALTKGIFQFLTRWIVIGVSREIEYDLRNDMFAHLSRLDYSYYQKNRTGDIMARATNDLNAVRMLLGPAIMYSANTIVFTVAALFFMWHISPKLTICAFAPLPLASIIIQYFGRKIHERFERIQAQFSDISSRVQENLSGARLIRAYVQEEPETALFETSNREYVTRSLPLARLMGMLWPALEFLLGLAYAVVLWLGPREVLAHRMTVGQFYGFSMYILMLTWPVIALGWVINIFQRGTASMGRINEILTAQPEITDQEARAGGSHAIHGHIQFRNLNFAYNGTPVLKDINLDIPAGTSLAIVGPTGSGKTTLVSLIPRIYDAPRGTILLDDRSIRDYPLEVVRRNTGFVPQETFLFSETVRENIAFGVESATDEQIQRAAQAASIAADIEGFPEQYQTTVGERGITLSGGQKQRSAIARAIIRDPRILILDDALASVDTYTEEKILNHLHELMQGRTTIFISHRVSTVRNADRIAVLHHGRIVELGTHEELLARNGYYTQLYNKQLLEEELERV